VVLTYGKQRGGQNSKFSEKQIFTRWFPDQLDPRQKYPFCNNANAAVRHSAWVGHPYDETLTGLEDLAWAKWAREKGFSIVYVPQAEVVHVHDETTQAVHHRYRREAMAFKQIYPEAHFNLYDFVRMTLANIFSDLVHAVKKHVFWRSAPSVLWFRTAQFWGTFQGYRQSLEWDWNLRQTFYYPHGLAIPEKSTPRKVEPIRYKE
jgi:rhamnosyltransferase